MAVDKPKKVFIGSSTTYIKLAHAFRMTFEHDANLEVQVWDLSRWRESYDNLTSLIEFLDQFQFGIFLLTPDDLVISPTTAKEKLAAPRDNVIFELGMWFGRAGRDRTWFVVPKNVTLKTPTDLQGLNPIKYSHPDQQEYTAHSIPHFRNAFATAHDLVVDNITEYQRRAAETNFFAAQIRHLQGRLKTASEEEAVRIVKEGLSQLLLERSAIAHMSLSDTLRDVLLWTRTLLDGLDAEQLAEAQDAQFSEVWVFAPEPLETLNGSSAKRLREIVCRNIVDKGVRYRYFVDDNEKIERIKAILTDLGKGKKNAERLVAERVSFVLLPEESFLSFFTVHLFSLDHFVYQSVARDNRDDFIVKVDSRRAAVIKKLIEKLSARHRVLKWSDTCQARVRKRA